MNIPREVWITHILWINPTGPTCVYTCPVGVLIPRPPPCPSKPSVDNIIKRAANTIPSGREGPADAVVLRRHGASHNNIKQPLASSVYTEQRPWTKAMSARSFGDENADKLGGHSKQYAQVWGSHGDRGGRVVVNQLGGKWLCRSDLDQIGRSCLAGMIQTRNRQRAHLTLHVWTPANTENLNCGHLLS